MREDSKTGVVVVRDDEVAKIETYFVDGVQWLRETRNGRVREQPLADALRDDAFERLCFFLGVKT